MQYQLSVISNSFIIQDYMKTVQNFVKEYFKATKKILQTQNGSYFIPHTKKISESEVSCEYSLLFY